MGVLVWTSRAIHPISSLRLGSPTPLEGHCVRLVGDELIGVDRKWNLLMRLLNDCLELYAVGVRVEQLLRQSDPIDHM